MKVTSNEKLIFVLEPENEIDQELIDSLDFFGRSGLYLEKIDRKPSPDVPKAFVNHLATINLKPNSKQALAAESGRKCLSAIGQLTSLALTEAANNGFVFSNAANPQS